MADDLMPSLDASPGKNRVLLQRTGDSQDADRDVVGLEYIQHAPCAAPATVPMPLMHVSGASTDPHVASSSGLFATFDAAREPRRFPHGDRRRPPEQPGERAAASGRPG